MSDSFCASFESEKHFAALSTILSVYIFWGILMCLVSFCLVCSVSRLIFSGMMFFVSLRDLLDDLETPLRLVCHVIVALLRYHVKLQVSVSTWLLYRTFDSRLVVVWRSFVGGHLVVGHRCTVGVLARTHRSATESRVTLWQSANPCCVFVGVVGVVTSCVPCARVRGRTSRSCATENTYTPAPLEALFKLSVVANLSPSYPFHQFFLRVAGALSHSSSCSTRSSSRSRSRRNCSCLLVGSVSIHLVHVNANLFVSRWIDQFRVLSRLSLGITAIFATTCIQSSAVL